MMVDVLPSSWDVGRRSGSAAGVAALAMSLVMLAAACGQAGYAAPPEPEFTRGRPPVATLVDATVPPVTAEEPDLDAIEPDHAAAAVDQMLLVDDAGLVTPNEAGWQAFDEALARRLIPGDVSASVAVMIDGQLVHQAAFGERVYGSGEPAEVTDRFRIGSISKTVTAIVTMQLVEQGLLTLDEPVGQLLIDHLHLPQADADVPGITVRELLSHTAGFPDHQATFFGNGAASYVDAARIGLSGNVGGGGYNYSNMSFCVLGVLIEAVTGKAYERVVQEQLLEPLGVTDMRITSTYELGPDEVSHHPLPGRTYMEALGAAGAWNATPAAVAAIINSVDPATPGWKALSSEGMRAIRYRILTPQPAAGYGLGIINYSGEAWGHTGTIEHAHSMVLVQPDGVTWAISVSGDNPSETEVLRSIMRSALATGFPGR
jgi:D-alanyl-D-alanine carboxypeptidase